MTSLLTVLGHLGHQAEEKAAIPIPPRFVVGPGLGIEAENQDEEGHKRKQKTRDHRKTLAIQYSRTKLHPDFQNEEQDDTEDEAFRCPTISHEEAAEWTWVVGALLSIPPSLLLGHDSTMGCQT